MIKRHVFNIYNLIGLLVSACCIYYILVDGEGSPFSIHSVLLYIQPLIERYPELEVGFLPIYVAFVTFGVGALGFYLSSWIERLVLRLFYYQKKNTS